MIESLHVVYEDDVLLAVSKPSGMSFHTETGSNSASLGVVQAVNQQIAHAQYYPLHRLDRVTSGLLLFAKDSETNKRMSEVFRDRKLEKYYLAISSSKPAKKQGSVIGDMCKSRDGSYKLQRTKDNPAVTRFYSYSLPALLKDNESCSDLARWISLVKIESGKTHQIRVALKSLASPILGDTRYKGKPADRAYLHSYRMRFDFNGKRYDICDTTFSGEYFQFNQIKNMEKLDALNMSWPKGTFLLEKPSQ